MCGRFSLTASPELVRQAFGYDESPDFPQRYNIAPTQPVALVMKNGQARHFALARWGFLPAWVKDAADFPLIFNARSETALEKASYRNAMRRRRCLVPANAWYEWRRDGAGGRGKKTPFMVRRRDQAVIGFAGLWETYSGPDGSEIDTVCILTTSANGMLSAIHERMPAVIAREDYARWLDTDFVTAEEAAKLLRPAPDEDFEIVEIGSGINKGSAEGPDLQRPVDASVARSPAQTAKSTNSGTRRRSEDRDDSQGSLF